jgi:hypothetical protein
MMNELLYAVGVFCFLFIYFPPAAEWVLDWLGIPTLEEMEDDK